jgi:tRNA (guanine37-N1)-methyltransferase
MRSRALVVPRGRAEAIRRRLRATGGLRTDLEVLREGSDVVFPITDDAPVAGSDGEVLEREFPVLEAPPAGYRDLVAGLPPAVSAHLPRAFDVVGDIVLIRLPQEVVPYRAEVGRALLRFVPGARLVGWDRGVHGVERRRRIEPIAGEGGFRTRHRENGLDLDVDLERAYFSPRLAGEHARVAAEVAAGERVLDLCCGIGPFALAIARDGRAREVAAVDLNPEAIALLRSNADRLGLAARIVPVVDDVERFLASATPVDRAILNLPHEGIKYLPSVARQVVRAGTLHYYEMIDRSIQRERPSEILSALPPAGEWELGSVRTVHPYSPSADLVALTFHRSPGGA